MGGEAPQRSPDKLPQWIQFLQQWSPNYTLGRLGAPIECIVIHWWDDPARQPQFWPVVNVLCAPARQASIHYVAEDGRVCQLVDEKNIAWHAGNWNANTRSIGIECNPRMNAFDLEVVAQTIAWIRRRRGWDLPLYGHQQFSSTACPGTYMAKLKWLDQRAREINILWLQTPPAQRPTGVNDKPPIALTEQKLENNMKPFLIHLANYATGNWKPGTGHLFFLCDPSSRTVMRTNIQAQAEKWAKEYGASTQVSDQEWQNALASTTTGVPVGYERWLFRSPEYTAKIVADLSAVPAYKERLDNVAKTGGNLVEECQRILGIIK